MLCSCSKLIRIKCVVCGQYPDNFTRWEIIPAECEKCGNTAMVARIKGTSISQNCSKCNSICKINDNKGIVYIYLFIFIVYFYYSVV